MGNKDKMSLEHKIIFVALVVFLVFVLTFAIITILK